jgi:hypothetical protein
MLRIDAHTTWRVREILRRWRSEHGMNLDSDASVSDDLCQDAIEAVAFRVSTGWWRRRGGRRRINEFEMHTSQ